ncbi:MAG: 3-phosphoshikimate 1-carboxyvinyltransferase [Deltaproteobacteria bacterium]|nr:3-phosphoshikimate 1-carboxyvinyltransferase [Deltaproteobacteria bacterium]
MRLPGDKSIAQRALLLRLLTEGALAIRGLPHGDDVQAAQAAVRDLSRGAGRVWCGESATLARLLLGLAAGLGRVVVVDGAPSLRARPMDRLARPLAELFGGPVLVPEARGGPLLLPLRVAPRAARANRVIDTRLPSAQVKSALLLAAQAARVPVAVREPSSTRDHTELLLASLGAGVVVTDRRVALSPHTLRGGSVTLPGDPSSAALLAVAVVARPGRHAPFEDVLLNPRRTGFLDVLARMGAGVAQRSVRARRGEPVGELTITGARLSGVDVAPSEVPALIDEVPALVAAALCARGPSRFAGVAELAHKESDRLRGLAALARSFGGRGAVQGGDRLVVHPPARRPRGPVHVETGGDHRLAMAALALGRALDVAVRLDQPACVAKSFPGFGEALDEVDGAR